MRVIREGAQVQLQRFDGAVVVAFGQLDVGQQLRHRAARLHALEGFEERLGLLALAQGVVRLAVEQQDLRSKADVGHRNRVEQRGDLGQRHLHGLLLAFALGEQGAQVPAARLGGRAGQQHGHVFGGVFVALGVEVDAGPGNARVAMLGLDLQRLVVGRQRRVAVAQHMLDGARLVVHLGRIGVHRPRLGSSGQRLFELPAADAHRNFGQPGVDECRVQRARFFDVLQRQPSVAQIAVGAGLDEQQLGLQARRQAGQRKALLLHHLLLLTLQDHRSGQQQHHLGTVHA